MTNFHLPQSTLLMLVSAFAGWSAVREAYEAAVAEGYGSFLWRCDAARGARTEVGVWFELLAQDGQARAGRLHLVHGVVETPILCRGHLAR